MDLCWGKEKKFVQLDGDWMRKRRKITETSAMEINVKILFFLPGTQQGEHSAEWSPQGGLAEDLHSSHGR